VYQFMELETKGEIKLKKIEEIFKENRPFIVTMVFGSMLLVVDFPLTFGEVCIVSSCFFFYLRLKGMILELSDSITKEEDSN